MHRLNPAVKIVLMIIFAVAAFYVPVVPSLVIYFFLIVFSMVFLHFRAREILVDMRPVLIYLILLYAVSLVMNLVLFWGSDTKGMAEIGMIFIPDLSYASLLMHLALSMEITSIFYRTTSILEFNRGFSDIERFISHKDDTPFADVLSLTITFIPRLVSYWYRIDNAYKAREGKNDIRRILVLTPVLFRTGMREAYLKALARENRM